MLSRQLRQDVLYRIFGSIPFALMERFVGTSLLLPYYHVISDEELPHIQHLYGYKTTREFKDDLDFLLKHYSPIGLNEMLEHVKHGRALPPRSFLLTFDDGYREMCDVVAPILLAKGISATFFVNSAFINNDAMCYLNKLSLIVDQLRRRTSSHAKAELARWLRANDVWCGDDVKAGVLSIRYEQRLLLDEIAIALNIGVGDYLVVKKPYLSAEQIEQLIATGFTIGGHSVDHPMYSSLSLEEQLHQTTESVRCVRELFHLNYGVFAFPHSDHNVSRLFFAKLADTGLVDASFGTAGLTQDSAPTNFQRVSLEKPLVRAEKIVAFEHARRVKGLMTWNGRIDRQ